MITRMLRAGRRLAELTFAILPLSAVTAAPAFWGAEGAGAASVGGRGGAVIKVTNLNDSGTGSFRAAIGTDGARTIVFTVGGTIHLSSKIFVDKPYVTVAGQTAPGGGIQITGKNFSGTSGGSLITIRTHDVIWRYTRLRHGDTETNGGDVIDIRPRIVDGAVVSMPYNIIIDHNSIMWSEDENVGIWGRNVYTAGPHAGPHDITLSWNIIAEPLNPHKTNVLTGAALSDIANAMTNIDLTKNYMASAGHRMPLFKHKSGRFISNLVYNANRYYMQGGRGVSFDVIANHYKQKSPNPAAGVHEFDFFTESTNASYPTGTAAIHVSGNVGPNNTAGTNDTGDNWPSMVRKIDSENTEGSGGSGETALSTTYRRGTQLIAAGEPITVISAVPVGNLALALLPTVGCSQRLDANGNWVPIRDAADARVIDDYHNGTGSLPSSENDVGGFPTINGGTAYPDTNNNGMSDTWESTHGVSNPNADPDGDGFTNLEEFLNGTNPNVANFAKHKQWVEAESAFGQAKFISPLGAVVDSSASGGVYIRSTTTNTGTPTSSTDGQAAYTCSLSGTVAIWLRINFQSAAEDSIYTKWDSESWANYFNSSNYGTWQWVKWGERTATGNHTFSIARREANSRVDRILFTNDLNFQPVGLGEGVAAPAAPSNLTATAVSPSQINLGWSDNSDNETGFKVERKTGSGGTYSQIATPGANATTHNDTTASANTTYYYRVRATNATGDSAYSNEANATTPGSIAFRAASSATSGTSSVTSLAVNKPSGVVNGDFMIAAISVGSSATSVTGVPSGWTHVRSILDGVGLHIYRKQAGSSEPSSYTWTIGTSRKMAGGIVAFSGVNSSTPIQVENGAAESTATATHTTPTISTSGSATWLVSIFADRTIDGSNPSTWTPPSGATERVDTRTTGGSTNISVAMNTQGPVSAGNKSHTSTGTATSAEAGMQIIAIQP